MPGWPPDDGPFFRHTVDGCRSVTTKQRKPQPVTAHRLFPAIVALWFAALLGIGSFVVPPAMLEKLVSAVGLPAVLPAAAPPLGFTARAMVALALTGVGALAGLVLALRLRGKGKDAAPASSRRFNLGRKPAEDAEPRRRARDGHPDAPARRPVAASEDLSGIEPLGERAFETSTGPVRRAGLQAAIYDESSFATPAPLPGAVGTVEEEAVPAAGERAPFAAPEPFVAEIEPVAEDAEFHELAEFQELDDDEPAFVEPPAFAEPAIEPERQPQPEPMAASPAPAPFAAKPDIAAPASPVAASPVGELGTVQLVERLAMAMAARRAAPQAVQSAAPVARAEVRPAIVTQPAELAPAIETEWAEPVPVEPVAAAPRPTPAFSPPPVIEPEIEADEEPAPLPVFSVEQEIEPELAPEPVRPVVAPTAPATPPARAFDRPAAEAPAPVVSLRPQAMQPLVDDFDDEDGDDADFLPRFLGGPASRAGASASPFGAPAATPAPAAAVEAEVSRNPAPAPEADETDGEDDDNRFSSLLNMSRPSARTEFVRVEEPEAEAGAEIEPVVVFPGQGPRIAAPFAAPPAPGMAAAPIARQPAKEDSEETDRALRAALATLQRMTSSR